MRNPARNGSRGVSQEFYDEGLPKGGMSDSLSREPHLLALILLVIVRPQSSAFTAMKKLIGPRLALLVTTVAQGTDTVIYAEDPRVDFILMKLRAAGARRGAERLAARRDDAQSYLICGIRISPAWPSTPKA
jgi:hypothetical protein